ncbi:ATP-binding protein [Succinivibrio sp.]|uniref:ATP-binding protein n=1 Tax=Succinivibrio sp. TaxID=2053619 RepID=UPI0025E95F7C|nr:ATP-binding protein [Succinivibrio sp.]MBQ9221028.1 ATP-binding protein [Succinivibrio sp.]
MERLAYKKLLGWKNNKNRKPLILNGARQVGKTWLLKDFGEKEYESIAYINCDETKDLKAVFSDFNTDRLIRAFSAISGVNIKPENTLIILDEIQIIPIGLTSLKYFCENAPEYHIAVAGSLLGIGLHEGTGFPVGKVDQINLYPLSFKEFLLALKKDQIYNAIQTHKWEELSSLSSIFIDLLRQYYYVGGMPAVVQAYATNHDIFEVRNIQSQILSDYRLDFSKHVPKDILPKVNMVWDSIPAQLAKENKKFIYSKIRKGARAKEFENAIQWLVDAGLVYKVLRVSKVEKPLKFYEDFDSFKLFILDLGLLGAMTEVDAKDVLVNNNAFTEYKGSFTEQYVLQELQSLEKKVYYHSKEHSELELDFVIQNYNVYPIEVKAEENLKSKSLRTIYSENNQLKPVRFSMADYKEKDWMVNVPLYLLAEWIEQAE